MFQIYSTTGKAVIFFVILLHFCVLSSRYISLNVISVAEPIVMRPKTTNIIEHQQSYFKKIRSMRISKKKSQDQIELLSFCKSNLAQVSLKTIDQIQFQGIHVSQNLIFDFKQIQYSRYLLDILHDGFKIYAIFKNHMLVIVTLTQVKTIQKMQSFQIAGVDKQSYLKLGYFLKLGKRILFVNPNYVVRIQQKQAVAIKGYTELQNQLQSAIVIQQKIFGVIHRSDEIVFYQLLQQDSQKQQMVRMLGIYNYTNLLINNKEIQLTDMAYWPQKKILFITNYQEGILVYKVQIKNSTIKLTKNNLFSDNKKCTLLYLIESTLYSYCQHVLKFNLNNWSQKISPQNTYKTKAEIKQLFKSGDLFYMASMNSLQIVFLESTINYVSQKNLDKFIFANNSYIIAKETGIQIGEVQLTQPYISCQLEKQQFQQPIPVLIQIQAQCNNQFFSKHNVDILNNIQQEDICVYTFQRTIQFVQIRQSQQKKLKMILSLGFIFVLFSILSFTIFYLFRRRQLKNYKKLIKQYADNDCESAKYGDHQETTKQQQRKKQLGQMAEQTNMRPEFQSQKDLVANQKILNERI